MFSTKPDFNASLAWGLTEEDRQTLLETARAAIRFGLVNKHMLPVDARGYPRTLQQEAATFVTLYRHGQLRGCIGTVVPVRPLIEDVAINAYHAAFDDPRFPPLRLEEFDAVRISISVLSPLMPMEFASEDDLLRQIRPGTEGLLLEYGSHRGILLPIVWKALPDRDLFWRQLKLKAGLPPDFWSPNLRVYRFTTERIVEPGADAD
ncbi:MAG: hypothetical protein KatS3mg111_0328 [Pirellulaceae bacterium]|nr:MAG: hypothetical protein KatS3mg111_0328 [Pirellulaceae bacterium]